MGIQAVGKRAKVKGRVKMNERLALKRMIAELRERMRGFPDERKGKNVVYGVGEVGMAAFSVFFMQNPSFLEHQRMMKESTGRNNAERLFGLQGTPSDNEIRNLLDPVVNSRPMCTSHSRIDVYHQNECGWG